MLNAAEARRDGRLAGKAAATWFDPGDERHARKLLRMLEEDDPMLDEYLPRRPSLSGEWAGESMNEILRIDENDDPDDIDEIADIWQEAADEAFDAEIERALLFSAGDDDDSDDDND
jgi:hypothetical protein